MKKRGHLRGVLRKLKRRGKRLLTPKYQFSGPADQILMEPLERKTATTTTTKTTL